MNDLRLALGYDQWNLYGVSYGTRLALTVMRDYPQGVRSVVLDSVYPLQVNLYTDLPENFDRSLKVLFETCAANADCSSTYPDLEASFYGPCGLDERPSCGASTIFARPSNGGDDGDWFSPHVPIRTPRSSSPFTAGDLRRVTTTTVC